MSTKILKRSNAGISLLEISIAMMVMGIVGAVSMPLYLKHRAQQAHTVSDKRQEFILMALAQYALEYQTLPCPSPDRGGQALLSCKTHGSWIGYLPFRTLGIPQEYELDGHHRPWTYAVWSAITGYNPVAPPKDRMQAFFTAHGDIMAFYDRSDQKIAPDQDPIALLLVSHPPLESSVHQYALIERPYQFQKKNQPPVQVFWITRRHLMRHYAGYSWHPPALSSTSPQDDEGGSIESFTQYYE